MTPGRGADACSRLALRHLELMPDAELLALEAECRRLRALRGSSGLCLKCANRPAGDLPVTPVAFRQISQTPSLRGLTCCCLECHMAASRAGGTFGLCGDCPHRFAVSGAGL